MRKVMVQALVVVSLLGVSAVSGYNFLSPSKSDGASKLITVYNERPGHGGTIGSPSDGHNNQ